MVKYGFAAVALAVVIVLGSMAAPTLLLPSVSAERGTLAILLTDPPHVPEGVTAVYITYGEFAVHVSNAGNESGWHTIQESGAIELLGLVNVSRTLSVADIPAGRFDMLKFNVTSALVTYNGVNYTAFVRSGFLKIPTAGLLDVRAGATSAVLIDLEPTVVNIGSQSTPEFVIQPVARVYPVPHSEITPEMREKGARMALAGRAWFKHLRESFTRNLEITSAELTANSLTIAAKNTGNATAELKIAIVSPLVPTILGEHGRGVKRLPPVLGGAAVFKILPNGTLQSLSLRDHAVIREKAEAFFGDSEYELGSGQTTTLTYGGEIVFGFGMNPKATSPGVVAGQQYLLTVIGEGALASIVVTAE